jgi:hypothetical protein
MVHQSVNPDDGKAPKRAEHMSNADLDKVIPWAHRHAGLNP